MIMMMIILVVFVWSASSKSYNYTHTYTGWPHLHDEVSAQPRMVTDTNESGLETRSLTTDHLSPSALCPDKVTLCGNGLYVHACSPQQPFRFLDCHLSTGSLLIHQVLHPQGDPVSKCCCFLRMGTLVFVVLDLKVLYLFLISGTTTGSSTSTSKGPGLKTLSPSKMFKGSGFHS